MNTLPKEKQKYIKLGCEDWKQLYPMLKVEDWESEMNEHAKTFARGCQAMEEYSLSQLSERDAEITSLKEKVIELNEYLENRQALISVLQEEKRLPFIKHLARIGELEHLLVLKSTEAEVAQKLYEEMKAENERLKALVEKAYQAGDEEQFLKDSDITEATFGSTLI